MERLIKWLIVRKGAVSLTAALVLLLVDLGLTGGHTVAEVAAFLREVADRLSGS